MLLTMALGTLEELRVYTARLEQLTKLKSPDRWQETGRRYIDILPE